MALLTTGTFNLTVNSSFDHALVSVGRGSHSFYLKSDYSQYLTFDILDLSETPITVQRVEILGVKFVNFDILDPGLYYVKVTHTSPPLSGIHATYSVFSDDGYYLLPVSNAAAEFNNATLTSGEHHPGKVLTASIDIADNDGTAGATKTYIWFRKSGSSFTEITSGTSDSYTVQSDDVGYSIYYSVSFTDDLGNSETSAKYGHGTSVAVHNTAAEFSNATLTSGEHHPGKVLTASIDIADNDGTAGATKTYIWFRKSGSSYTEITSGTSDSYTVQSDDVGYSIYYSVSFTDDLGNSETSAKYGHGTSVAVHNTAAEFSNATLTSGEHHPGKVLTASIDIADNDGTAGATKTYIWFRKSGSSYTEITSGTSDSYTVQSDDVGYSIYYSVSFTDDLGNSETSAKYGHGTSVAVHNDAPTISSATSLTTDEDTATAAIAFSGSDADGDTLTFSFSDPAKGSVVDNGNGTFTYTPDANANGSDSFTITANDGIVDVVETINVAIAAVNDAPTIVTSTSLSTDEDTATAAIAFSGSDIDGDTLTFSFNDPAKGSVVDNGNGTFTYTPDANANGSDSFTITANDGTVDVVETINVAIAAVNDAPTIVTSTSLSTDEDTATAAIGFSGADVDGDTLTFTFSDPAKGSVVDNGNGTFTYTPDANANGSDSFTITANDGTVDVVETINVAIAAVNDAPTVSTSTSLTTDEDTATAAIGFSGADVDGDTLTFTFSDPAKGSVVDNGDGTFTYTPDANTNGSDDFTISVNDGTMDVTETINLTVTPDNSPPAGQVGLKGTPVVGQTLTLDLSLLADPDGISQINSYHWLRNDVLLNDDTALAGGYFSNNENLKSYTITDADVGSNMSVKVVYEDGKGLNESIISLSSSVIKQANNFSDLISFDTHGYSSHQPKLVYLENGNIFASWLASEHADGSYNGAYISVFNQNDSVVTPQLFSVSESGRQYSGPVAQLSDGSVVSSWYGETKLDWHPKNYYLSKFRDLDDLSDLQSVDASYRSADYFANIQVVGLTADEQDNIYVLSDYVGYLHLDILDQNLNQIGSTIELEPQTFSNAQSIIHDDKLIVSGMKFDSAAREYKIHLNAYAVTETDFNPESITHQMAANPEHNASAYVRDTFITLEGNVAIIWREGSHGDVGLPYLQEFDVATLNPLTDAIQLTENDTHKHVTEVKIVAMGDDSYLMASSYYHRVLELDDTGHLQERYKSDIYIKYLDKDFNSLSENKLIGEGGSLSLTTSDFGDVYLSYSFEGEVHVEKLTNFAPEITIAETLNIVEDSTNNTFFLSTFDANDDPITYNFLDPEHGSVSLNGNDKFVYTPDADFAGTENITLVARDQLLSTTHNFSISVRNTNDAPIISTTTSLTTDEDKATVEIAFSGSDVDVGDTLTFSFSDPAKGSVVDNGDGTFTYTPDANANGSDSFTLTANDGTVDVVETINVAIAAVNDAPSIFTPTSLTTDEDTATAAIEFIGADVDGDTLTFSFSDPAKGSVVDNGDGTFTYTPDNNANGSDSFTLTANDGTVDVEETISVTINAANDAPTVSTSTSLTTDEDTATAAIEFSGSDVDGDTLTFSFSDPAKGSVVNNGNGTFTYTPAANANGSDSFTLTANDGTVDVEETISVTINAANDAPTVSTSTSLTTDEDTATAAIVFSGSDADGDTLTFSFSDPAKGSVVDNGDGTFAYTPDANANGSDSFTITANDGTVDVVETINVAIAAVNDAPTVSTSTLLTTDEDTTTAAIVFSGSDADGDTLTFSFRDPAKGSVVDNGDGTFAYTPDANANGSDSFTITANDGTVDVVETINVAIAAVNDAPTVSTSTSLTTDEDTTTAAIVFSGSDADGDTLTFSFSDPAKGSVVDNGNGTFTYTPDANANGSDSFTLTANDGTVDVEETIGVTINAVNDAPTVSTSTSLTTDEDNATAAIGFSGADVDGDTLTFTFSDPAKGSVVDNGDGTFTYTPDANANGSDSFTLTANDGTVDVEETIGVTINAVNDAPTVSTSTSLTTDEDNATAAIGFSGADVDGDTLTFTFSDPAKGSVVNNGNGTFTYTPDANANGSDSFTLTANDGTVDVEETISVTINAVNDAPTGDIIYHGKFVENQTISADVTQISDHDGLGDFEYIWKKDGQAITGENTQYYTLKNNDVASIISAEVTFTDSFGTMETVLGAEISEISMLGDLLSLDFGILETSEDTLEHRISVKLSDSFSRANSISLLYWKEGEDQTWITLERDGDTDHFKNNAEINRFASEGDYAVRRIDATDDFGSSVKFTEEKMIELGFDTKFTLVNSKSDSISPEVQQLLVSDFYYDQISELWKLDYSLTASDEMSGLQSDHIFELVSPTGSSLQNRRYFDENGEIATTLSFDKHLPSGDYTINTVRIYDLAGNKGWLVAEHLSDYGQESSITLDNPFGDNDLPSLDYFKISAEFNPDTLRPSILFDFVTSDSGSGYKNAYVRISDQNGLNNDRWINDADKQNSGIQFGLDLTQEYTSGQFTIDFFNIYDNADNKLQINTNDFLDLKFENSINVFFKPEDAHQNYVIQAADTDDWLIGSNSEDIFVAGDGDDYIYAGDGDDDVYAGTGDDLIIGGSGLGDDIYRGGEGIDTIKYTSALASIIVDLKVGTASSIDENDPASIGSDTLFDVENVIAGDFDDIVKGSRADNILNGGSGNDTLTGGAGSDTFKFEGEFGHDTVTDYNSNEDILEFYASDETALNISDFIESVNTDGNRVLSTSDGGSSVTIEYSDGDVIEGAAVAINTTITDRFGDALSSAEAHAYEDSVNEITATSTTDNVTVFDTASGSDVLIDAVMEIDTASDNAIGAFDALQALRLAVGLDKSDGTSEWHDYIAADINKDGRVGADDALNILKFAVGLTDGPPADWVFVDGDADHSGIDRSNTDYDEGILIHDVMTDMYINMTGILVGDVDGSYIA